MKILIAHNRYRIRGGEDNVFEQERDLLRAHGHEVVEYVRDNSELGGQGSVRTAVESLWSRSSRDHALGQMRELRPDIIHVHNTLPLISPSIYSAAKMAKVPLVQTLHNYRLLCANGMLMRNSKVCEDCVGRIVPWPAIWHRCYRSNLGATAAVVGSNSIHRVAAAWHRGAARYIALSSFARKKLLEAGLPEDRVVIKPNFAVDCHSGTELNLPRAGAIFLGRLSEEKGVDILLRAWEGVDAPLAVVGGGQAEQALRAQAPAQVSIRGFLPDAELLGLMRQSIFIVMPSRVYEGFPMVVAEAFAAGLPIIASRLGALAELIEDGKTGLHFAPGDAGDLARKASWAIANPDAMAEMGRRARQTYEKCYTPDANYRRLIEIYKEAIQASVA